MRSTSWPATSGRPGRRAAGGPGSGAEQGLQGPLSGHSFDLSNVLFITTANNLDTIPAPLLDRMDVIELPSYTRVEKYNIAKRHLLPKQLKNNGLGGKVTMNSGALYGLIDGYTREGRCARPGTQHHRGSAQVCPQDCRRRDRIGACDRRHAGRAAGAPPCQGQFL